tara:strand:+ start:274 stop:714 length:441 start_codon:yes stop_codon:yes gene_type:complete
MAKKNKLQNKKSIQMKFITDTQKHEIDFELYGFENYLKETLKIDFVEIETINERALIEWHFDYEVREWGIKSYGAYATKISFGVYIECLKGNDENIETISHDLELTKLIKDFELNTEFNIDEDSEQILIREMMIDFDTKKILITFN